MAEDQEDESRRASPRPPVTRWIAVQEALASVRAEGLEPSVEGLRVLEAVAADEMTYDEAIAALDRLHRR